MYTRTEDTHELRCVEKMVTVVSDHVSKDVIEPADKACYEPKREGRKNEFFGRFG